MAKDTRRLAATFAVLNILGAASAVHASVPAIDVRLSAGEMQLDPAVISEAKAEVVRIFAAAGVSIAWNGEGETDSEPTRHLLERSLLILVRTDESAARLGLPASAMGMAQATKQARGRVAFIFWNRVQATAMKHAVSRLSFGRMLGITIAHELGHLLLPAGHGSAGLMKDNWDARDFLLASRGLLVFHNREAEKIRERCGLLARGIGDARAQG